MTDDDRVVAEYLRRLRRAARGLPAARRRELIDEITGHITEARAAAAEHPPGESVPAILAQLGEPADIVRASGAPAASRPPGGLEIAAMILIVIGGFLGGVGWVAGCILLWVSPRWRWTDKLLGTLVWPGGLLGPVFLVAGFALQSGAGGTPAWLPFGLLVAALAAEALVVLRLVRHVREVPEPDPSVPQPSF